MTTADLDAACAAGTVLVFSDIRRYRIAAVGECDGLNCPIGGDCIGVADLRSVDYPTVVTLPDLHFSSTDQLLAAGQEALS
jgi:hypothetical protein